MIRQRHVAPNPVGPSATCLTPPVWCFGSRRLAFSLVELLIVLAILAVVATFTLPALRGPMDKARLRGAGRVLETAIAKTRSLAIRTGQPHWLTYEPGGRAWQIEADAEMADPEVEEAPIGSVPGLSDLPVESTQVIRTGLLPEGVSFAAIEKPEAETLAAAEPLSETELNWSDPIRFTPVGRTANREIIVRGARGFEMQVRVRGLTGAVVAKLRRQVVESDVDVLAGGQAAQPERAP